MQQRTKDCNFTSQIDKFNKIKLISDDSIIRVKIQNKILFTILRAM